MVTRLQSEKGSFVQSPLGAFDGEADFECFPARLAIFEQAQEEPRGFDPTPFGPLDAVLVLNIPNQPLGNVFFTFTRDVFPTGNFPPFEVFKDWYFVGRTSGAIWRPSDWGNFVFTYNVVNAITGVPEQTLYTAAPPQAVEGDAEIWNEWYQTNPQPGPQFFVQTNPGYGIARDLRNPADTLNGIGFVSETVDICDESPLTFTVTCDQNVKGFWHSLDQGACLWDFALNPSGTDWLVQFQLIVDGVRSPTVLEYETLIVGTTWIGQTSGLPLTFVDGTFFCDNFPIKIWIPGNGGLDGVMYSDATTIGFVAYAYLGQQPPAWVPGEEFILQ